MAIRFIGTTLIQSSHGALTMLVIAANHLRDVSSQSGWPGSRKPNELIVVLMIVPLGFASATELVGFY